MPTAASEAEAKANQRTKAKRATLDMLLAKKPNREEFTVPFGPDGAQVSFLFVSVGATEYDALLTEHPPTAEQRVGGASFNVNSFAPALLARVCREPAIDVGSWNDLWVSPSWGRGELMSLFWRAANLCSKEVDPVPIKAG
jgi:hypothetical protein